MRRPRIRASWQVSLVKFFQNCCPRDVCVPEKHSRIAVSTYQGYLRHTQAHLKEATDSFVPKVVEVKIG